MSIPPTPTSLPVEPLSQHVQTLCLQAARVLRITAQQWGMRAMAPAAASPCAKALPA